MSLPPPATPSKPVRSRTRRLLMAGVVSLLVLGTGFLIWWWVDPGIPARTALASFQAHPRAIVTWYTSGHYERPAVVLAFSPDGRLLATGGEDDQVKLWDTSQGRLIRAFPFQGKVEWVGFSGDGRYLIAEGHGSIPALWNVIDSTSPAVPSAPAPPVPLPPGDLGPPPSQPDEATAQVWTVADGAPLGPTIFVPPRRQLVREGGVVQLAPFPPVADPRVAIWADAIRRDGEGLWGLLDARPTLVSRDGHHLATGGSGDVWLTRADGRPEAVLTGRLYRAPALAFSRDGRRFAAGSATRGLTIRDLESGHETTLPTPSGRTPLAFSPDSRLVAYVGRRLSVTPPGWYNRLPFFLQRTIRPLIIQGNGYDANDMAALWDCQTGVPRAVLPGHNAEIYSITFSEDGHLLATADWEGQVRIWPTR